MANYILTKDSQWTNDSVGITPSTSEQTVVLHTGGKYVDRDIALKINAVEAFDPSELPEAEYDLSYDVEGGMRFVPFNAKVSEAITDSNYSSVSIASVVTPTISQWLTVNNPGYLSQNYYATSSETPFSSFIIINGVTLDTNKNFDIELRNNNGTSTFTITNDINGNLLIR